MRRPQVRRVKSPAGVYADGDHMVSGKGQRMAPRGAVINLQSTVPARQALSPESLSESLEGGCAARVTGFHDCLSERRLTGVHHRLHVMASDGSRTGGTEHLYVIVGILATLVDRLYVVYVNEGG
jgi:hypothetical protein